MTAASAQRIADARPLVVARPDGHRLSGGRCASCGHAAVRLLSRCPRCGGEMHGADFGPDGTVWSSTTVHVATPGRPDPYTLAYVDLDDGPRLLAHVQDAAAPARVGARATLVAPGDDGDPRVRVPA